MKVWVHYLAGLGDARGLDQEEVDTEAQSLAQLYQRLDQLHFLGLPLTILRVAVDDVLVDWEQPPQPGTHITFLPPVSGG